MTPEEYASFKAGMKETIRNMLGDAMQDIEDYASDQLEQRNFIVQDVEEDYEKLDQWVGLLVWEIVTEWGDTHEDPFLKV